MSISKPIAKKTPIRHIPYRRFFYYCRVLGGKNLFTAKVPTKAMAIIIRKLPKASYVVKKALIVKPINTHSADSPDKTFSLNDTFGIAPLTNADNPKPIDNHRKMLPKAVAM